MVEGGLKEEPSTEVELMVEAGESVIPLNCEVADDMDALLADDDSEDGPSTDGFRSVLGFPASDTIFTPVIVLDDAGMNNVV